MKGKGDSDERMRGKRRENERRKGEWEFQSS